MSKNQDNPLLEDDYSPFFHEEDVFIDKTFSSRPKHIANHVDRISVRKVCGEDDRELVEATSNPYRMICRLHIKHDGNSYVGSGFFISPRLVITSGHCVFKESKWASSIAVIPGANGLGDKTPFGKDYSVKLRSVKGWTKRKKREYDYGAIYLKDNSLYNRVRSHFNFRDIFSNDVRNSGYPNTRQRNYQQWEYTGQLSRIGTRLVEYNFDTNGGNSGSPVFYKKNERYIAVGVHSFGRCPNYFVRVIDEVKDKWEAWIEES